MVQATSLVHLSGSGLRLSQNTLAGQRAADEGIAAVAEQGGVVVQAGPDLMAKIKELGQAAEAEWLIAANAKGIDGKAAMAFFKSLLK